MDRLISEVAELTAQAGQMAQALSRIADSLGMKQEVLHHAYGDGWGLRS
jgi:hypothetical protein